jgi:GNAT superfamily N-acetyltransferase
MTMLMEQTIRKARASERGRLIDAVTLAFATDPAARWMYPDPAQYRRYFPTFVELFGMRALEHHAAYCADGCLAAALWLPPGVGPDEDALMALVAESVQAHKQASAFALFEEMAHHHPSEPHWYLPLIGVGPMDQGRGLGSALLEYALKRCDRDGTPSYLESTSPKSVPLYERHGFDVVGVIQVGSAPPIFPMVRPARAGRAE